MMLKLLQTWNKLEKDFFVLEGYTTAEEGYNKGAVKDPLDVRNVKRLFNENMNCGNMSLNDWKCSVLFDFVCLALSRI